MKTRLRVGKILREKNMKPSQLADRAGIAPNTALNLSRGAVTRVDLPVLDRVAKALGVRVVDLFEEVEDDLRALCLLAVVS